MLKVDDEVIAKVYLETGSVWRTAEKLGLIGQTVHRHLVKIGVAVKMNVFSDADKEILKKEYTEYRMRGRLDELALKMGRTKQFICRQARAIGLTKQGSYVRDTKAIGKRIKAWQKKHGHPRGALGMKHTVKTLRVLSDKSKAMHERMTDKQKEEKIEKMMATRFKRYGRAGPPPFNREGASWKSAWREIAGQRIYFRSRWEYNYAVYLQMLVEKKQIRSWKHEPKTFWFLNIKRGVRSYLPDYLVVNLDGSHEYHEVKGWMDSRSRTTISRMNKYYPEEKLRIIDAAWFKSNGKVFCFLPGWEH